MLLLLLRQPEVRAIATLVSSILLLILSANSLLIPSFIWAWVSCKYVTITVYFIFVVLIMRWFARGGQYKEIESMNLDGQTHLITGAGGGIGKETAFELAKRGARVILFARSTNLAEAIHDVKAVARSPDLVTGYPLDLADLKSIKSCVDQFMKTENKSVFFLRSPTAIYIFYAQGYRNHCTDQQCWRHGLSIWQDQGWI